MSQKNENNQFTTANTSENVTVFIKLPVANQSTNLSTSITIKTVIKNDTSPSVRKFNGAVITRSKLPRIALSTHNDTATIKAVVNQDRSTFGAE